MTGFLRKLKYLDAYPKTLEDFRIKTLSGAAITIACLIFISSLFVYEFFAYLAVDVQQELFVDTSIGGKMPINIDIIFPTIPCELLSIDSADVSGEEQADIVKGIKKRNIDSFGQDLPDTENKALAVKSKRDVDNQCGSCYGAETPERPCCNTCEDVKQAYREKKWQLSVGTVTQCIEEGDSGSHDIMTLDFDGLLKTGRGCRIVGHLDVNKVAGTFHIAPGFNMGEHGHFGHTHDIKADQAIKLNTSHTLKKLYFGGTEFPNQVNPLDNVSQFAYEKSSVTYNYFLKVVPTTYQYEDGSSMKNTFQYSVTKSSKALEISQSGATLPGVVFSYELSPIMVKFVEKRMSFTHFVTSCCAIFGGAFTVAGLLDSFIYKYRTLYLKGQINKLT